MRETEPHKKLGDLLIAQSVIDSEQLKTALGHQRRWGGRLGEILVGLGFASERAISQALSRQLGIPEVDLASLAVSENAVAKVPFELCQRYRLIPLAIRRDERGSFLHVAMADPSDLQAIDDLRFQSGLRVEVVVAPEIEIEDAIRRTYRREIEKSSPFGESRKFHQSTGELLRFGEKPVDLESQTGAPLEVDLEETSPGLSTTAASMVDLSDLYGASDPALSAVEALVRLLTRKGILEKGEYLREVLKDLDEENPKNGA